MTARLETCQNTSRQKQRVRRVQNKLSNQKMCTLQPSVRELGINQLFQLNHAKM